MTHRIYIPGPWPKNQRYESDEKTHHYLRNVLRKKDNEDIEIFDGKGTATQAILESKQKKTTVLQIVYPVTTYAPATKKIHLGLAVSKMASFEFALQKAVELGASVITPTQTAFCNLKSKEKSDPKKQARWSDIIIHSCQQCRQNHLPHLMPITPWKDWVKTTNAEIKFILDPRGKALLDQPAAKHATHIALATGPEGGFSDEELQLSRDHDFLAVNFGPRILRAETAPIVGLSLLQYLYGDFQSIKPSVY